MAMGRVAALTTLWRALRASRRPGAPGIGAQLAAAPRMLGASLSVPLVGALGYLALFAPVAFILVAAVLSFIPGWSPSDFPFRAGDGSARAAGKSAASVTGVR